MADLVCPEEPAALTDDQVNSDLFGTLQLQFEEALVLWGRTCKDALARTCQWHKDRGDTEIRECRALIKP